ncbi:DUF3014 domain-containing protein [Dyella sp. BiH032]|uniref:DUF3014 domain-containing protein n=1 Tax=Dyella sp. BiH032 TaxID=3075430 RepID=UPI00289354FE|nr:DUF3014 domain-containing protein [Dyella sp. BiH032]WNL44882.1 DUF3014 domain-containing protein [Dyella sp. BiH032]
MVRKDRQTSFGAWIVAVAVVAAAIAAGVYLWRKGLQGPAPAPSAPASSATGAAPAVASSVIRHPIADAAPASASTAPLPALDGSDGTVADELAQLGGSDLAGLLLREQIIPHVVATIDALPRQGVAVRLLPLRTPRGPFAVDEQEGGIEMSPRNAERYAPYLRVVEAVDAQKAVAWYVRYYPLFQQAYRDLGYPHGYFNDRLIVAIDDMLAAPQATPPVALVRTDTYYRFVDPSLQQLSAGQKLMLRLGPENAAKVKAKLREIRAALAGQGPARR